jgi:hypothetical protein
MAPLPVPDASADFVVAHGIWNRARSSAEFRQAVADAGRAARPGAALFVFTFSRHDVTRRCRRRANRSCSRSSRVRRSAS